MTKQPESVPVEDARKKFADILDGTQHHSQHVEITRRGKRAGVVVPPEWYDRAIEALTDPAPSPPQPTGPRLAPVPAPQSSRERRAPAAVVPMTDDRAEHLAALARERADAGQWQGLEQRTAHVGASSRNFAIVAEALGMGLLSQAEADGEDDT